MRVKLGVTFFMMSYYTFSDWPTDFGERIMTHHEMEKVRRDLLHTVHIRVPLPIRICPLSHPPHLYLFMRVGSRSPLIMTKSVFNRTNWIKVEINTV